MEQAMAYVCCPAEESRVKVQRYCRKIYELGYVPICPRFGFLPFLDEGEAEDQQAYNRMSHLILKRCRMVVVCGKEVTGTTVNTLLFAYLGESLLLFSYLRMQGYSFELLLNSKIMFENCASMIFGAIACGVVMPVAAVAGGYFFRFK